MEGKNNVGGGAKFRLILRMSLITFFFKKVTYRIYSAYLF